MDARERWQALQAQLACAQDRLRAGDRAGALAAVEAALAIDPNFLAAHALRDRVLADSAILANPRPTERTPIAAGPVRPLASPEGYAQFEQRARRRRVDRKLDAARTAIAENRRKEAATAIHEIRDLDPELPELREVIAAFHALPPAERSTHGGRWLAAAAVFGTIVLGTTWLEESGALGSRSVVSVSPLVSPPNHSPSR